MSQGPPKAARQAEIASLEDPLSARCRFTEHYPKATTTQGRERHRARARGTDGLSLLTVERNLRLGGIARRARSGIDARSDRVFDRFPRLRERRRQLAGSMSGSEQQMLAIGRGLMAKPEESPANVLRKLLDMAAQGKKLMLGYHWPYPGLGRAEAKDGAFVLAPAL